MKTSLTAVLLVLGLATVNACGFQPLYGDINEATAATEEELARIQIGNIPDREGQMLRNALIDRLQPRGQSDDIGYRLDVSPLRESLTDLDITKSADTTRAQLRLDTSITLKDIQTGEILLSRSLRAIASYNILGSEFATRVSENNTRENAIEDLARQIELQLALYFKR